MLSCRSRSCNPVLPVSLMDGVRVRSRYNCAVLLCLLSRLDPIPRGRQRPMMHYQWPQRGCRMRSPRILRCVKPSKASDRIIDGRHYRNNQIASGETNLKQGTWCSWFIAFASHFGDIAKGVRFNSGSYVSTEDRLSFSFPESAFLLLGHLCVGFWSVLCQIPTAYMPLMSLIFVAQ